MILATIILAAFLAWLGWLHHELYTAPEDPDADYDHGQ